MDKLIPAFKASLFDSNLTDLPKDIIEAGIDSFLDNDALKEIPIFRTIIGVAKTAQNIYDRNLLRQTSVFIEELNSGTISPDKLWKYQQKINNDPKCAERELSRVLILLNSTIDLEKSKILAKLYKAYISEKILWDDFCELTEALNRLFTVDINLLITLYQDSAYIVPESRQYQIERLVSQGLFVKASPKVTYNMVNLSFTPVISDFGRLLASLIV